MVWNWRNRPRDYARTGWHTWHKSPEFRAEIDRWARLYLAVDKVTPEGQPQALFERLTDAQVFDLARLRGVDPADFGFEV